MPPFVSEKINGPLDCFVHQIGFISLSVIALSTDVSHVKFTQYPATFSSWPDETLPSRGWRERQADVFSPPGLYSILNLYGCTPSHPRSIQMVGFGFVHIFQRLVVCNYCETLGSIQICIEMFAGQTTASVSLCFWLYLLSTVVSALLVHFWCRR